MIGPGLNSAGSDAAQCAPTRSRLVKHLASVLHNLWRPFWGSTIGKTSLPGILSAKVGILLHKTAFEGFLEAAKAAWACENVYNDSLCPIMHALLAHSRDILR